MFMLSAILPSQETGFLFGHAGSAGNNSRTNDAVTRELRRLIGHVVRHGYVTFRSSRCMLESVHREG